MEFSGPTANTQAEFWRKVRRILPGTPVGDSGTSGNSPAELRSSRRFRDGRGEAASACLFRRFAAAASAAHMTPAGGSGPPARTLHTVAASCTVGGCPAAGSGPAPARGGGPPATLQELASESG